MTGNYKVLDDRESRGQRLMELSNTSGKTVLCGKINYPGPNKNTEEAKACFRELEKLIDSSFSNIVYKETWSGDDGSAIILLIEDSAYAIKKRSIALESDHTLGRLFDIDIYFDGLPLSRSTYGEDMRTCIVCGGVAKLCIAGSKHKYKEVKLAVSELIGSIFR